MAEVLFNKIFIISFIFFFYSEFFLATCYVPVVSLLKTIKLSSLNQQSSNVHINNTNKFYFVLFLVILLFWKKLDFAASWIFFLSLLILYIVNNIFESIINVKSNNIVYIILPSFLFSLTFLIFIDSFILLFFFIELYGVFYYFCFISSYNFTTQTILKYKNGLLMLLWNNFLTTFFLALGCLLILKQSGSTNFIDLTFLDFSKIGILIFLVGLFWKLGLPIFQFFKLEVYRYLLKENVFLFSILTTLINFLIVYLVVSQSVVFTLMYSYKYFVLILVTSLFLIITNLKLISLLQFLALSGVFTLTTSLTVLLI